MPGWPFHFCSALFSALCTAWETAVAFLGRVNNDSPLYFALLSPNEHQMFVFTGVSSQWEVSCLASPVKYNNVVTSRLQPGINVFSMVTSG